MDPLRRRREDTQHGSFLEVVDACNIRWTLDRHILQRDNILQPWECESGLALEKRKKLLDESPESNKILGLQLVWLVAAALTSMKSFGPNDDTLKTCLRNTTRQP
jgi:hypothetical protein